MEHGEEVLKLNNLCKFFGDIKAVNRMSVTFRKGEVHTIIGENGSGKSTIANCIAGILKVTSGEMYLHGKPYNPSGLADANASGISMLVQEERTINNMTIAENIFMGKETMFSKAHLVKKTRMIEEAKKVLSLVGLEHFDPDMMIGKVSLEDKKLIEVGVALYNDPEVIIFDETTTALSLHGREIVYKYIEEYREKGRTVIMISHMLDEVKRFSDTVTVMRDGIYIDTLHKDEGTITDDDMRKLMIGRDLSGHYYRSEFKKVHGDVVLKVENISYRNILRNVSLKLHEGEILGIGGLTDCGMHELCKVIFGIITPAVGTVTAEKNKEKISGTDVSIKNHIAYLSKNRDRDSLLLTASVKDNIFITAARVNNRFGFHSNRIIRKVADKGMKDLQIKASSREQLCCELSGGNKQKVVVAKWLANNSDIFIMDCPTRGIDVGVKAMIYEIMEDLIKKGKSIIMVSEELAELIGMSDRIIIMKEGQISGEVDREEEITEMKLIEKMV